MGQINFLRVPSYKATTEVKEMQEVYADYKCTECGEEVEDELVTAYITLKLECQHEVLNILNVGEDVVIKCSNPECQQEWKDYQPAEEITNDTSGNELKN